MIDATRTLMENLNRGVLEIDNNLSMISTI